MATVHTHTAMQAYALQARTNSAGAAVDDVTGEDLRIVLQAYSEGIIGPLSFRVRQRQAGANMSVDVGSGTPDVDLAIVRGRDAGQGNYMARLEASLVNVTVPAAHGSLARIDQVYLVFQDNAYDASARVLPSLAYRDGTAAGSPVAPGPDAAWDAYLLLANIAVPAADTSIQDAQITDMRVFAGPAPTMITANEVDGSVTAGNTNLTGSFVTVATLNLIIPTDWVTWKCVAWAEYYSTAPGGGFVNQALIQIDGTDQETYNIPESQRTVTIARRTGIATTGSRAILLRAREASGTNGAVNEIFLYARAVRTS